MTQYKDEVNKHKQLIAAENWGKEVRYLHASGGVIEVAYNNGEKHFEETASGKKWKTGIDESKESLIDRFTRYMNDVSIGRDPHGE